MIAVIFDALHLELRFSVHYFRWGMREVLSVLWGVVIRREQRGVKDIVDSP